MNIASELRDISVTRAVLLQQLGTSISNEVKSSYLLILDDLKEKILKHEELNISRVRQIIKEIKDITFPKLGLEEQFKDLAIDERDWVIASTNKAIGAEIFKAIPPESVITAIGSKPVIEGALLKDWLSSLNDKAKFDFQRNINLSLLQGESTQEAAKRMTQTMGITLNNAETLVRTSISYVTNEVREEVYKSNSDIMKGKEFSAVMDNRTSKFICAPRDGALYDMDNKPLNDIASQFKFKTPPLHPRCRSIIIPVLKSWEELGIDITEELPATTKSSMDGQVSSKITFEDWLRNKPKSFINDYLGEGRAKLFLDGKINMTDLLGNNGKALTLDQLRAKYK